MPWMSTPVRDPLETSSAEQSLCHPNVKLQSR
jgi:hypothetical protein